MSHTIGTGAPKRMLDYIVQCTFIIHSSCLAEYLVDYTVCTQLRRGCKVSICASWYVVRKGTAFPFVELHLCVRKTLRLCRHGQHYQQKSTDQPGMIDYQSCTWSAEEGKYTFHCPCSRLRIWSRQMGSAVPFRVRPLIIHTQPEAGA